MKKIQKHSSKRTLVISIGVIFFLCLTYAGLAYYYHLWPFLRPTSTQSLPSVDYKKPTVEQTSAGQRAKDAFPTKQTEASQQQSAATGQAQTAPATTVEIQVPTRSLTSSSTTVSSIISTIDNGGKCTLTLTKPGANTIAASSSTQTMGSYSSCSDFSLNLSNTPKGEWQLTLTYTGSANQAGRLTKVITIE